MFGNVRTLCSSFSEQVRLKCRNGWLDTLEIFVTDHESFLIKISSRWNRINEKFLSVAYAGTRDKIFRNSVYTANKRILAKTISKKSHSINRDDFDLEGENDRNANEGGWRFSLLSVLAVDDCIMQRVTFEGTAAVVNWRTGTRSAGYLYAKHLSPYVDVVTIDMRVLTPKL